MRRWAARGREVSHTADGHSEVVRLSSYRMILPNDPSEKDASVCADAPERPLVSLSRLLHGTTMMSSSVPWLRRALCRSWALTNWGSSVLCK